MNDWYDSLPVEDKPLYSYREVKHHARRGFIFGFIGGAIVVGAWVALAYWIWG